MAQSLFNRFPNVGEQPVFWGDDRAEPANAYKAIVNLDSKKVYSIVSNAYKIIRHEEAICKVEKILNDHPEFAAYDTDTALYNEGGRLRKTYRFNNIKVEIQHDDWISAELHLYNSYDLTWPFVLLLGAYNESPAHVSYRIS